MADSALIEKEVVQHVLFAYDAGGYSPGSFTTLLIQAFQHASALNFMKLAQAFPDYGYCIDLVKNHEGGLDQLKEMVA